MHHLLNHTSGLHNALGDLMKSDPMFVCDWEETLNQVAKCTPETEPGSAQIYHYLSFGWLCGGVIEVCFFPPSRILSLVFYENWTLLVV